MNKHTPLIRLEAARRAFRAAQEACPHWDYEGNHNDCDCCRALDAAERELMAALIAAKEVIR